MRGGEEGTTEVSQDSNNPHLGIPALSHPYDNSPEPFHGLSSSRLWKFETEGSRITQGRELSLEEGDFQHNTQKLQNGEDFVSPTVASPTTHPATLKVGEGMAREG